MYVCCGIHSTHTEKHKHTQAHMHMYTDVSIKRCDHLYLEVLMSVMSFHPENNLETVNLSVPAGVHRPRWVLMCARSEGQA